MVVSIILFGVAAISIILGFIFKRLNFIYFVAATLSFISGLLVLYFQQVDLIYLLIVSLSFGALTLLLTIIRGGKREL